MKFELVEQTGLSGAKTPIYSILMHGEEETLYEKFVRRYYPEYPDEITDIDIKLEEIGNQVGLRDSFYTPHEGAPGDGICALFDNPDKKCRLYFIGFGKVAVVLGGGGPKSKKLRAFQESQVLTEENYLLRKIAIILNQAIKDKRLVLTEDGFESEDGFVFSDEEED